MQLSTETMSFDFMPLIGADLQDWSTGRPAKEASPGASGMTQVRSNRERMVEKAALEGSRMKRKEVRRIQSLHFIPLF